MGGEKLLLEPFYATCEKSAKAAAKEINNVECLGTLNERVKQNWFRYFKEIDTSLKDRS